MRLKAYVLASDPNWIEAGVLSWYHLVEEIVVSYDVNGIAWTGVPLSPAESLARLRAIDWQHKMRFCPGDFAGDGHLPLACETRQRQFSIDQLGTEADWILQLDTDEMIGQPAAFVETLRRADAAGFRGVEYPARWLYLHARGARYLEMSTRRWELRADYPGPVAIKPGTQLTSARQIAGEPLYRAGFRATHTRPDPTARELVRPAHGIFHFSMVRSLAAMETKLASWGHADDPHLATKTRAWLQAKRHPLLAALATPFRSYQDGLGKERHLRLGALPRAMASIVDDPAALVSASRQMERPVFILSPGETFTPTHSGALATVTWELCQAARREGVQPVVIASRAAVPAWEGVELLTVDFPPEEFSWRTLARRAERKLRGWTQLGHRAYARRIRRTLEEAGLTRSPLVIANDPDLAVWLRRCFPHAYIAHVFHNQLPCCPRARARFAAAVDAVLAVSEFTARWIAEYYRLPALAVQVLPNGVSTERFSPAGSAPAGRPVIGFVGRTGREKAPDLLLRAALRLSERTTAFAVHLIGSNHWDRFEQDPYQAELQSLSRELTARGVEVRWLGHVSRADLPAELHRICIQVVPSRWDEPFGLVTLEAMASGLAVVASDTGGTREVLGETGCFFARESEEELAALLGRLLDEPELRGELGRQARQRAETFSWERTWGLLGSHLGLPRAGRAPEPGLVSVLIPAWNSAGFLAEAIESALMQTYRPLEVIVVDDGSTDRTPEVAAAFAGRIVYVRKPNGGTASARNAGLRRATGEFIALLDADDRWLPHKLEQQIPVFRAEPRAGIVCAGIRFFSEYPGQSGWEETPPARLTLADLLAQRMPPSQTTVYRRAALESVGGFDETLRGGEDWDAALRVAVAWEVHGLSEVLAEARVHPGNKGADKSASFARGMKVLGRHARLHRQNADCQAAAAATARRLHDFCASALRESAGAAWRRGARGEALRTMLRALWLHPQALTRLTRHLPFGRRTPVPADSTS